MRNLRLAVPLSGKMSTRSYHNWQLTTCLQDVGVEPKYFVGAQYFEGGTLDRANYFELKSDEYARLTKNSKLLKILNDMRRFGLRTETTDLRLRERLMEFLVGHDPVYRAWSYGLLMDFFRHLPGSAELACWLENRFYRTEVHSEALRAAQIDCVLTPGMGGYAFYNEGLFAREAMNMGLRVFASITNYDNLVNMGFRGFMPHCVGVWSETMANDAMRLHNLPANRVEVTGPVQYDRYFVPMTVTREDYLRSKGLDPKKKTILYAGGHAARGLEIYRLFFGSKKDPRPRDFNFVVRAYPHSKIVDSPAWKIADELFRGHENVYISDSLAQSADNLTSAANDVDINFDRHRDELQCLLRYSDVLINHFSTISLEAALCDLPFIHVGYDVNTYGLQYNSTAEYQQRQTHNKRPLRLSAAAVPKSETELLKAVETYFADRAKDGEKRREYALSECGFLDGKSCERLSRMIRSRYPR